MSTRLARIVPNDPDSPVAKGVKVITADGSHIRGIKKITLVAENGNRLWTAHLEMTVLPPVGLTAQYETTDITSEERELEADHRLPSWAAEYIARLDCDRHMQLQNMEAILNALQRIHDAIRVPPPPPPPPPRDVRGRP